MIFCVESQFQDFGAPTGGAALFRATILFHNLEVLDCWDFDSMYELQAGWPGAKNLVQQRVKSSDIII